MFHRPFCGIFKIDLVQIVSLYLILEIVKLGAPIQEALLSKSLPQNIAYNFYFGI